MRAGGSVTYVDQRGVLHPATITEVSGTGASGAKLLDLTGDSFTATDVPHRDDAEKGAAYWHPEGLERRTAEPVKVEEPESARIVPPRHEEKPWYR
jgi:hypothetical protein